MSHRLQGDSIRARKPVKISQRHPSRPLPFKLQEAPPHTGSRQKESPRKALSKALSRGLAFVLTFHSNLGSFTRSQKVTVLMRQARSPPLHGMAQVYGYAASEMIRVGKHAGKPWRQRELKHPEADIRLQDTSQIGKGTFAQIESLALTLCDILRGELGIITLNVVLRRIAPTQGRFTDILQPQVIFSTFLELLDQGGDITSKVGHGRQKTSKPNSKPLRRSAALQEVGNTLAQKVRNRQKLRGLEPALAFFDGDDRGACHPELLGE